MDMTSSHTLRNHDADLLLEQDQAHHFHPFTDHKDLHDSGKTRLITNAKGTWLTDSKGNHILDGMAGLWCVNVGYGRTELAKAAYDQMCALPYYNTFFKTTTPPAAALAARVADLLPEDMNHVFFGLGGSDAVDSALRMVRHFWGLEGKPYKRHIISRLNGYHGSSLAGAATSGMRTMHRQAGQEIKDIHHICQPYWYREGGKHSPKAFGKLAARALEDKILELGPQNVAAFIAEPIQGAGGVIIPPETYWPAVQRICRKYDVLLICDEVICGFGRTGHWFGHNAFSIKPDLVTMAKGLSSGYIPISAVGVNERMHRTFYDKGGEFYHGFTYSGHPAAAAVALANIDIIEEEDLVTRTHDVTGPHLALALARLSDHPLVGEVRSRGLIGAIELVADKKKRHGFDPEKHIGSRCRDHIFARNAVIRACGDTLVVSPPLIITPDEIDQLVEIAREGLDALFQEIAAS